MLERLGVDQNARIKVMQGAKYLKVNFNNILQCKITVKMALYKKMKFVQILRTLSL